MSLSVVNELVQLLSEPSAETVMNEHVLVSMRTGPNDLEQSTEYRWADFVPAFEEMAARGIAGQTFQAPSVKAGLVNIALFLAQSMHETIQFNACDNPLFPNYIDVPLNY